MISQTCNEWECLVAQQELQCKCLRKIERLLINSQIDSIGGEDAVQTFGGRNYSYPKVDADTVDTQQPTGNARSGGSTRADPTANVTIGSVMLKDYKRMHAC